MQSYLQVVVLRPEANFAAGNSSKARRLPCGAVGAQCSWLVLMEEGLDLLLWLFFLLFSTRVRYTIALPHYKHSIYWYK